MKFSVPEKKRKGSAEDIMPMFICGMQLPRSHRSTANRLWFTQNDIFHSFRGMKMFGCVFVYNFSWGFMADLRSASLRFSSAISWLLNATYDWHRKIPLPTQRLRLQTSLPITFGLHKSLSSSSAIDFPFFYFSAPFIFPACRFFFFFAVAPTFSRH